MSEFDAQFRKIDPDRSMAALFAPKHIRHRLQLLYHFYHDIARIPNTVSESMIGHMRLNWARDAVADLFAHPAKIRRHVVYEGLAELKSVPGAPDQDSLILLIEARAADLGQGPFPNQQERLNYIDQSTVTLMRLAARLCHEADLSEDDDTAIKLAGRLWGYIGLAKSFAAMTQAGCTPLTQNELDQSGLTDHQLAKGANPDAVMTALRTGLLDEARTHLEALTGLSSKLPADLFPAMGYTALAKADLKALAQLTDPYREKLEPNGALRQLILLWASLTGRF